jgi:uncharacterized protein YlxW (UPF0749 family)
VVLISIDWIKAEKKPKKSQKVKGRDLVRLRVKIAELEKELNNKLKTIEKISKEMNEFSLELNEKTRVLNQIKRILKSKEVLTREDFINLIRASDNLSMNG